MATDKTKTDDREQNKELCKKMINPYYFTHRVLKARLNIEMDSHHNNRK